MRPAAAIAIGLLTGLLVAGCGSAEQRGGSGSPLLQGTAGALSFSGLDPGARLARRFATAYARNVYRRFPPPLPGATAPLMDRLTAAAARVPAGRQHLRPRALTIAVTPVDPATLSGSVEIGDGESPVFSVAFTVERTGVGWRVTSVSPPG